MNTLLKITLVLSIIGSLNWGLVGLFDFNLVDYLFGSGELISRIIYTIIMAAGIINIAILTKDLDETK